MRCDSSQDRELRPEEMDGTLLFFSAIQRLLSCRADTSSFLRAEGGLQGVRQGQRRLHRVQRFGELHEDDGVHAHGDGADRTEPADQHEP